MYGRHTTGMLLPALAAACTPTFKHQPSLYARTTGTLLPALEAACTQMRRGERVLVTVRRGGEDDPAAESDGDGPHARPSHPLSHSDIQTPTASPANSCRTLKCDVSKFQRQTLTHQSPQLQTHSLWK